jgi:5-bromo-4-chloroindolyl phosphate hydrolysis protein
MDNIKLNYALIFAMILQAVGLIWYVSKLDSKVETVYKFYEEESQKSVVINQAKMKFEIDLVMKDLKMIKRELQEGRDKSKEIMKQHGQIFELLQNKKKVPSGYNYSN